MNDQSHFMINLKADRNNKRVTTIDKKIKENFSEHSEKSVEWYYVLVRKVHCTTLCTTMYHNVLQCTT